jgi:hypothetical protein
MHLLYYQWLLLVLVSGTTDLHDYKNNCSNFLILEAMKGSGKPTLFVQAGIHSGEIDGKDAG